MPMWPRIRRRILCIDLENLPITGVADFAFSDGGIGITTSHILYCDAAGTIYVFGSNKHSGSTVMLMPLLIRWIALPRCYR